MINYTLYKNEMKKSIKLLSLFVLIVAFYIVIIIQMYDPKVMKSLDMFFETMPQIMQAVGMKKESTSLIGFMISYLYGFILIVFPMLFCIILSNQLIVKYVEDGSIVNLLLAPVKRKTVVCTQLFVLISNIVLFILIITGIQISVIYYYYPSHLEILKLIQINLGLLLLHLSILSISFFASCLFNDTKKALLIGAGIPCVMFVIQMLINVADKIKILKYLTIFELYQPTKLLDMKLYAYINLSILGILFIILSILSIYIFNHKDLSI